MGAALGATGRFAVVQAVVGLGLWALVGTFSVNVVGSFALGYVVGRRAVSPLPATVFALVAIGLLGSFTTFSTMAFEVYDLFADARPGLAVGYAAGSVVLGLLSARGGVVLGERR